MCLVPWTNEATVLALQLGSTAGCWTMFLSRCSGQVSWLGWALEDTLSSRRVYELVSCLCRVAEQAPGPESLPFQILNQNHPLNSLEV